MKKILFLTLFFLATPAFAQEAAQPPMPAPIKALVDEGAQARYLGDDYGAQAWLTVKNGQEQYFYVLPGGKAFVMGVMFDEKGKLVTVDQVQRLRASGDQLIDALAQDAAAITAARQEKAMAPTTGLSSTEQLFSDVEGANWIPLGKAEAPVVYAFIDPQCPHCHDLLKELRAGSYLDQGKIQLRIIPVGFKPETRAQAAYLVASPDPAARLLAHLDGDKEALPVKAEINDQGIQRNVAIMQSWKFDATPFLVYRGRDGSVKIVRGKPQDLAALMKDLPAAQQALQTSTVKQ